MDPAMFASRTANVSASIIREILKLTQGSDIISFGGGFPSPQSFPVEEMKLFNDELLAKYGKEILQYGTTEGFAPLRERLAKDASRFGIMASKENVLLTTGAQQVIDLMAKALLDKGDVVLVENPTFLAALNVFKMYEARIIGVDTDDNGIITEDLERKIKEHRPKMLYIIPNFQNPTGITTSLERRRDIMEACGKAGVPLLEDDPYCLVRFEGEEIPATASFDKWGTAVYASSFSKTVSPGIRLGYAIAPKDIMAKLVVGKQTTDVCSNNLAQRAVYEFIESGRFYEHIKDIVSEYRPKRDLMLKAMDESFPRGTKRNKPMGGLFLWAKLPKGLNSEEMLRPAIEKAKVAYIPGSPFYIDPSMGKDEMRLNFTNATQEQIKEGIKRLGDVLSGRA
ncbi:MAG TPA: PLP-dependent aminotransferase family protein [Bacillota bacterium]|nr:PLP-dependent aminotransferase family protein [Bacillota bacterium]HOA15452.1 PLP-dependent aminotransferase family protein [Bacillota bacterium]HOG53447.1 PLP-dependent aminotransferase family protein [Bacillota bacterium]